MTTKIAESRKTGPLKGAASAVIALAGLLGMEQITNGLVCAFGVPLKTALESLPTIVLTVWHLLQPCALDHLRRLEGLLQFCVSLRFVLTLTGA